MPQVNKKRLWLSTPLSAAAAAILSLTVIYLTGSYGFALFVLTPFFIGICAAVIYGYDQPVSRRQAVGAGLLALGVFVSGLLFFGLEGLICIAMVAPVAVPLTVLGGIAGHACLYWNKQKSAAVILLSIAVIPATAFMERDLRPPLRAVVTSIEIDAPPQLVWKQVIAFPELKEPEEFIFKTGVAYPVNATIEGTGVGAVRHCNFTTGSFVEPVTVWDEPRLLQFDVEAQPMPLKELSFREVDPPHLHDYFVSEKGQFRLVELPGGRTLLEGTTWYYHNIRPAFYWRLWSDYIIHKIHLRVLEHIKANSEQGSLNAYPKEISEIISSKSKYFPDNTQISIALVQEGKTNYYGIIKVNDTIKPIENQNKVFEIGSITKVFTSTVLASLVEERKIKLTDEINPYYPFSFKDNIRLKFINLANHTSGLPRLPENLDLSNETNPYKSYGKKQIEDYLKNILKLEKEPAKNYSYSNLGAGLLGYTLGLSQKTGFQEILQRKVFDKYEMKHSFMSSRTLNKELVKGQNPGGEVTANWDFDVLFAAGGILSTTADLVKFASAQFNPENTELALTRKPTFKVNENMKIGLGWHLLKSKSGKDLVWHNGGTGGYSSSIAINTNDKTAVIILSNVSAFHPERANIDELCFELMNEIERL